MHSMPSDETLRRPIAAPERDALLKRLALVWGIDRHYWWPLSDPRPPHAEAFDDDAFEREFGYPRLQDILASHGVARVLEFGEDGDAFDIALSTFEPVYSLETFWSTDKFDWIIYASHESSITVAGAWLLPAVQAAWPDWHRRRWGYQYGSAQSEPMA